MLLLLFLRGYLERAAGKDPLSGLIYLGGGLVGNLCSYLHELSLINRGSTGSFRRRFGSDFSAVRAMLVLLAFRKKEGWRISPSGGWPSWLSLSLLIRIPVFKCRTTSHNPGGFLAGSPDGGSLSGNGKDQEKGKTTAYLPGHGNRNRAVVSVTISLVDAWSRPVSVFLGVTKGQRESADPRRDSRSQVSCTTDGQKVTVENRERFFDRSAGRHCFRRNFGSGSEKADEIAWYQGQSAEWRIP